MNNDGDLTRILKRTSILVGGLILLISIYLSFDGFDGAVSGANKEYDLFAIVIGITFAVAVTILQFIFTSSYKDLNATLKAVGLLSYAYSIYTNMLGAMNILHMDANMAWVVAIFADIVAEPMIAWGLGEALVGDLLGNIGKSIYGKPNKHGAFAADARREIRPEFANKLGKSQNGSPQGKNLRGKRIHSVPGAFKYNKPNPHQDEEEPVFHGFKPE